MTEKEVLEGIRPVVAELQGIRDRLLLLEASLPVALVEEAEEDLDEMDSVLELRSVLRCVVGDCMRPAITDLGSLCRPAAGAAESPAE